MIKTDWVAVTVAELAAEMFDGPFGSSLKTSDYKSEGVRVARLENIGHLHFRDDLKSFVSTAKAASLARHTLRRGDVLFSSFVDRGTRVCLVPDELDGKMINKADCFCIRTDRAIFEPKFLAYRLAARTTFDVLNESIRGVTRPRIGLRDLAEFEIELPPLAEQRRIVAKLEALTARLARARAELDRVPTVAERLRQQTARAAFDGSLTTDWRASNSNSITVCDDDLNEAYLRVAGCPRRKPPAEIEWRPDLDIPTSWRWVSVDQAVAQVQYGSSVKSSNDASGIPVLRMGNIQRGNIDWTDLKYLPVDQEEFPALLISEGDVLFNRTNSFELVGKTAVVKALEQPTSFASYLIRVRPSGILGELLAAYLNSPLGRSWIERVASQQVGQANVNGSKLRALGIPLPPFEEQAEMLRRLNTAFARADRLEAEAARARALLDRLESAILAKAFRGELVPQDPNDEPAGVLLERIRAQRAAAPMRKRGRRAMA